MLFKLDKSGEGQEICIDDLGVNKGLSFVGFSPQMFLEVSFLRLCQAEKKKESSVICCYTAGVSLSNDSDIHLSNCKHDSILLCSFVV